MIKNGGIPTSEYCEYMHTEQRKYLLHHSLNVRLVERDTIVYADTMPHVKAFVLASFGTQ